MLPEIQTSNLPGRPQRPVRTHPPAQWGAEASQGVWEGLQMRKPGSCLQRTQNTTGDSDVGGLQTEKAGSYEMCRGRDDEFFQHREPQPAAAVGRLMGRTGGGPPREGSSGAGWGLPSRRAGLKEPRHLSPSEQSSSGLTADTVSCSRCKLAAPRTSLSSDSATQRNVGTGGGGRGAAWVPGRLHTSCPPAAQMPLLGRGPGAAPPPTPPRSEGHST